MTRPSLAVVLGLLAPLAMAGGCDKCKKDTAPPPLPTATETASAAPEVALTVEDAGEDVEDADDGDAADAAKVVYKPAASLKNCCAALAQNAASAPPPTNIYLTQAAAACNAAVAQGKDKASVIAIVSGALKGAGMPAACR
jgi:hypothetical protein